MKYKKTGKEFFHSNCLKVASALLGKILVKKSGRIILSGMIVETEAYTGKNDEASHSYNGMTKRNMVMFGEGGKAYVYFTYGNHFCLNVVTGKIGVGSAVLIRGIEPLTGIEIFKKNRGTDNIFNLTNGPGKICQAFGIGRKDNGTDLFSDKLFIAENDSLKKLIILKSKRIGITKNTDKLWRFFIKDNPHVSRKQKLI